MFSALVTNAFAIHDRATVLTLQILAGQVRAGDQVEIRSQRGATRLRVLSVEYVDRDVGRGSQRSEVAIVVKGLKPEDVAPGTEVAS